MAGLENRRHTAESGQHRLFRTVIRTVASWSAGLKFSQALAPAPESSCSGDCGRPNPMPLVSTLTSSSKINTSFELVSGSRIADWLHVAGDPLGTF